MPRTGYIKVNPQVTKYFFPRSGHILSHGLQVNTTYYFNEQFHRTDNENLLSYQLTFRNRIILTGSAIHDYVELLRPFDPTNTGKDSLAKGTKHTWNTAGLDLVSQPQQLFTYSVSLRYGGYFADGTRFTMNTEIGYRFQPYVSLALSTSYDDLHLPQPWGHTVFFLVGPKTDITMTNKLFFTTYLQYNEQQKNINFNARFQWRYQPASDLFIVYTDNYYPAPFFVKNRALVLKLNYWWNMVRTKKSA